MGYRVHRGNSRTPLANVTGTSYMDTGQLVSKAVDGVADGYPGDYTREWATVGQGAGAHSRYFVHVCRPFSPPSIQRTATWNRCRSLHAPPADLRTT